MKEPEPEIEGKTLTVQTQPRPAWRFWKRADRNRDLDAMSAPELLNVIEKERGKERLRRQILGALIILFHAFIAIDALKDGIYGWIKWIMIYPNCCLVFAFSKRLSSFSDRRKKAGVALSKNEDVSLIGHHIETLTSLASITSPTEQYELVRESLFLSLPKLTESDARLLNSKHFAWLRRQFVVYSHYHSIRQNDFQVVILKAYERIGGASELDLVKRIATSRDVDFATYDYHPKVVQAARECLPHLQNRILELKEKRSLLRPASVAELPEESLLRPAVTEIDTEPEKLLRPADTHSSKRN